MSKLYPPQIEGTIPAFYGDKIIVPFSMNRAVGKTSISGFTLKIKTVQNSMYVAEIISKNFNFDTMEVTFILSPSQMQKLNTGQHYKVQLAYLDKNDNVGYYSTVGIVKYTSKPEVYIEGMKEIGTNIHNHGYLGVYKQSEDYTEKVYSSKFIIYNANDTIYYSSKDILHNATEDVSVSESSEYYEILDELPEKKSFYIEYQVTTNNNLVCSSPQYKIMQKQTIDAEFYGTINASLNFTEGCVHIDLAVESNEYGFEDPVTGAFLLSRANVKTPKTWEQMCRFILQSEKATGEIFRDYTVEHGETYIYSLQQYNDNGLYSNRMLSDEVYVDFEDSFLFDGTRQLKIRFNPKISSFKNTIPETKVDTIGNQFPFIFRNGNVNYKDFPISGLISYFMDEEQNFYKDEDFSSTKNLYRKETHGLLDNTILNKTNTTNHTNHNIYKEKNFKLDVLDWLTNGETKLFRSPTEGNYLVRLMNVSLSPNDTLGRMLHTFNCNAYEVAPCDYHSMLAYGVIDVQNPEDSRMRFSTKKLVEWSGNAPIYYTGEVLINDKNKSQRYIASSFTISDMMPGDFFYLNLPILKEGDPIWTEDILEKHKIVIGSTGSYSFYNENGITSIYIPEGAKYQGSITFGHIAVYPNTFSLISDVHIEDEPLKQVIGPADNIIEQLEDLKTKIYNFSKIVIYKKDIETIYSNLNKEDITIDSPFYWNKDWQQNNSLVEERAEYKIYIVRQQNHIGEADHDPASNDFHFNEDYYLKEHYNTFYPVLGYLFNKNGEIIFVKDIPQDIFKFTIDNQTIDLGEKNQYIIKDMPISTLSLGSGLILQATYIKNILSYYFEEELDYVIIAKNNYEKRLADYNAWFENKDDLTSLENLANMLDIAYQQLLDVLQKAIDDYKEEHALD